MWKGGTGENACPRFHSLPTPALGCYSYRSEVAGSIRIARRAGNQLATQTTKTTLTPTPPNVTGLHGFTPNNRSGLCVSTTILLNRTDTIAEPARPKGMPHSTGLKPVLWGIP